MNQFVFVVLSALLVGGALGDAALGNYYKDVVREQHRVINEMNQNFTDLEKASEKLIDLGFYVGKHKLPPKTVKITKTVAVKVPVPFPVKVPEPVPVPVPVSKPVPVPVPTLVAIPVESTVQTTVAVTAPASTATTIGTAPPDADAASSQAHPSTVQVQEYVQSFPIHSVYDAGDDYNPMEGNRLALAEHTASPTESTFSKQSPSSLQQLEEYQQRQQHQQQYHREKPAQTGSYTSAEQYRAPAGFGRGGEQRQYYHGTQVQTSPHPAAQFGPEPHALKPSPKPYGGPGLGYKLHTPTFARAPDSPYSAASVFAGGQPAPSAPSAGAEGYRFAGDQLHQRGGQYGGGAGSGFGQEISGADGGAARGGGAGRGRGGAGGGSHDTGTEGAQSYVKYSQATESEATNEKSVPRFQSESETLQAAGQGSPGREEITLRFRQGAGPGKEVNDLTPRPFQTVRESYPRYEKPDFARYHSESGANHQHSNDAGSGSGGLRGGSAGAGGGSSSVLTEGYDHSAFGLSGESASSHAGSAGTAAAEAHRHPVQGGRTYYQKVSTAGYHHSHPRHQESSGEAHQDLRHQADASPEPFPFYHATKHDPHLGRGGVQPYRADAPTGGPAFQRYTGHKESAAGGGGVATSTTHHHHAGDYNTFTEHHHHQQQHEHFGKKYTGSYGTSVKPTVYSVPSDAHLFPNYPASGASDNHDDNNGRDHLHHSAGGSPDGDHHHHHQDDATSGKFQYHFHNVHIIGGDAGADHHQPAASEHQYAVHGGEPSGHQHDGSLLTSYDPPASGNTFHFHDDDLLAGASDAQEQLHRPVFEDASSYEPGYQ